jgi:toxin CcdB
MTRQFDVVPHPIVSGRHDKPYLIDVQTDHLGHLRTRVTAALVVCDAVDSQWRLYPEILVLGRRLYFDPTDLVSVPVKVLGTPIANLESLRDRIIAAIDLIITGV